MKIIEKNGVWVVKENWWTNKKLLAGLVAVSVGVYTRIWGVPALDLGEWDSVIGILTAVIGALWTIYGPDKKVQVEGQPGSRDRVVSAIDEAIDAKLTAVERSTYLDLTVEELSIVSVLKEAPVDAKGYRLAVDRLSYIRAEKNYMLTKVKIEYPQTVRQLI